MSTSRDPLIAPPGPVCQSESWQCHARSSLLQPCTSQRPAHQRLQRCVLFFSILCTATTHVSQSRVHTDDIERKPRRPHAESAPDPYMFRGALKTDDELSQLRRRYKHGKSLESYHRKQNNVRVHQLYLSFVTVIHPLISAAHPCTPQIDGRSHQRSQGC